MKHLMRYEGYDTQERLNDILDKISKHGVSSLTTLEKEFLDSHSSNKENEVHDKIKYLESDKVFEDDNGYFKFEYDKTENHGDELFIFGTIYVPKIEWENGEEIEGRISGKIIVYPNGQVIPDFEKIIILKGKEVTYDIFEFCSGLEYELDNFIDYVISELDEK